MLSLSLFAYLLRRGLHAGLGMALHTARSVWDGVRGRTLSLPYSAPCRVSIPPASDHDTHAEWSVRVEHEGMPRSGTLHDEDVSDPCLLRSASASPIVCCHLLMAVVALLTVVCRPRRALAARMGRTNRYVSAGFPRLTSGSCLSKPLSDFKVSSL